VKTSPKRSYSVIENERFGLVFAKTVSIISGTGVTGSDRTGRKGVSFSLDLIVAGLGQLTVFLNVYGAPASIPRNEFRQPM
jgi:hypothetical protein